jgi:nitrogen PTS system EIIA component
MAPVHPKKGSDVPHRIFNLHEVAEYLHLTRQDVEKLARRNEIPFEKKGEKLVFRRNDVDAWASQRILGNRQKLDDFHSKSSKRPPSMAKDQAIIPDLLKRSFISPVLKAKTKSSVLSEMVKLADATGLVNDKAELLESLREREAMCSTALAGGIALLHPRHHQPFLLTDSFVVLGRTPQPVPFGSPDGMTTSLFFLVCSKDERLHLHVLARLCVLCYQTSLLMDLREADSADAMYENLVSAEREVIRHLG